jgi:hypothetical protein
MTPLWDLPSLRTDMSCCPIASAMPGVKVVPSNTPICPDAPVRPVTARGTHAASPTEARYFRFGTIQTSATAAPSVP